MGSDQVTADFVPMTEVPLTWQFPSSPLTWPYT